MNNEPRAPMDELPEAMLEEAAVWQARLRDANSGTPAGRKLRANFNQWLLADTRHRQAYAEMESLWNALETPVEQVIAEESASYGLQSVPSITSATNTASRQSAKCRTFRAQGLAMVACLVLAVFVTVGWQQDWVTHWQSDYVTAVGEEAPIVMDDDSRITLNTDSALATDYSARERRVRLLKGEAWFDVASDDSRPFIVATDAGAVRVTGTQFNVRLVDNAAVVSLDEGRVELRVPGTPDDRPVVLEPGLQAILSSNGISAPTPFDRTAVTAWLRGQFVFYNTPLAEVVETLNRHRHGRILVTSKELNNLEVSGIFSTEDPDAALEVITSTLPIRQTRLTDYLVLIR